MTREQHRHLLVILGSITIMLVKGGVIDSGEMMMIFEFDSNTNTTLSLVLLQKLQPPTGSYFNSHNNLYYTVSDAWNKKIVYYTFLYPLYMSQQICIFQYLNRDRIEISFGRFIHVLVLNSFFCCCAASLEDKCWCSANVLCQM